MAGAAVCVAGAGGWLLSDKHSFIRTDSNEAMTPLISFKPGEREILFLASLAPSGHNTQPWFVQYIEPYHWVIGNDKSRWLPGVDPTQRETILSIGAFLQNLEYAADSRGYKCRFTVLASTNQDEKLVEVKLAKATNPGSFNIEQIKLRRTVRSNYLPGSLSKNDIAWLVNSEPDNAHFIPPSSKAYGWLNEQTIAANRIQAYRDAAQEELANWTRFSSKEAEKHLDGLTTAGMEIEGIPGWVVRNFYKKPDVMKKSFRDQTIDKVKTQVEHSGGWLLVASRDNSVLSLLETGKSLQRILLKIRERNIAIHPMTQLLEESSIANSVNESTGISNPIQFVLRTGYIKNYPAPVSLRRPVDWFVRS
jgi:hypothetical protein